MANKTQEARLEAAKRLAGVVLTLDNAKSLLLYYTLCKYTLAAYRNVRAEGLIESVSSKYLNIVHYLYNLILATPQAKRKLKKQLDASRMELKQKLITDKEDKVHMLAKHAQLPMNGQTREQLTGMLSELDKIHKVDYESGKVSGAVYHGHSKGTELGEIINEAMQRFLLSNPLHPDVFPGVRKMEAEVIAMTLSLFHADPQRGCGTTTSGGTESIIMACKAYRDWARVERGITEPEMVIPISAHAAFDKAGEYFRIKIRHIPVDPISRKVNLKRAARAINSNTILLVGSAPNFPDGIIDPIPELSALAQENDIPLHVDCCLGSFIVPFLEEAGYSVGSFDFKLLGVTSISCDTHKYGFAPKGSSIIMYAEPKWRHYQYFVSTAWPGGVYASPSIAGSRPGALLAGAWAAMLFMGRQGYLESCKQIVGAARQIVAGIRENIPELEILGDPKSTVVAFQSETLDIYAVGDKMSEKGWHLNALQNPPAVHICCTRLTVPVVGTFLSDLREAVEEVKIIPEGAQEGSMVQIYGLGKSSVSGPFIVSEFAKLYLDVLYEL